mgnify:FL=1
MEEVEELRPKRCLMDAFFSTLIFKCHCISFSSPKEFSDHESKSTFLPEFVKMRVVNAQVGIKNLPLCEKQRFLFQCLQNGPFAGLCRWWRP